MGRFARAVDFSLRVLCGTDAQEVTGDGGMNVEVGSARVCAAVVDDNVECLVRVVQLRGYAAAQVGLRQPVTVRVGPERRARRRRNSRVASRVDPIITEICALSPQLSDSQGWRGRTAPSRTGRKDRPPRLPGVQPFMSSAWASSRRSADTSRRCSGWSARSRNSSTRSATSAASPASDTGRRRSSRTPPPRTGAASGRARRCPTAGALHQGQVVLDPALDLSFPLLQLLPRLTVAGRAGRADRRDHHPQQLVGQLALSAVTGKAGLLGGPDIPGRRLHVHCHVGRSRAKRSIPPRPGCAKEITPC